MSSDEYIDTASAESADRLVGAEADAEESAVEAALRPKELGEFIGQSKVREQLDLVLKAARQRGGTADHVLLSGAPGLGKTTLSMIIAAEMAAPIRITSGPAIQHAGDLAAILSSLQEGEVLFLDEIHRMSRPAEEMLYMAMEDFRVDVIVGKGPGATAIPLELPPFTLVGATTRAGLLPPPLRDRFGFTAHMEFYEPGELEQVMHRSARLLEVRIRRRGRRGDRRPQPRHAPYRQPTAAPRKGLRTGQGGRSGRPGHRLARTARLRGRRARPGPARPRGARRAPQTLRRRARRALHALGRGGGGAGDRRGGGRAVPRARGAARPHAPRPRRHTCRVGSHGPREAAQPPVHTGRIGTTGTVRRVTARILAGSGTPVPCLTLFHWRGLDLDSADVVRYRRRTHPRNPGR